MHLTYKHYKTLTWFYLLFIVAIPKLQSQVNYLKFNHLTVNDGLSQNSVQAIAKDKYGFLWFGTWEGANRFDGYNFKIFRANEDDSTALSDNRINSIIADSAQNIWIKTSDVNFTFKYSYERENFIKIPEKQVPPSIHKLLRKAVDRANRKIRYSCYEWKITNEEGLIQTKLDGSEKTVYLQNTNNPFSLSDNSLSTLYVDENEYLWIGSLYGGVNFANLCINHFNYYFADGAKGGLVSNIVRAICTDETGRIWIGSENKGITVLNRESTGYKYTYYANQLIDPNIRSLKCDKDGFVWIGTKGGLDRYNPRTNSFKHYYAGKAGSIAHPWVFSIIEDHAGMLWVGTYNGIARYDRGKDVFVAYDPLKTLKNKNVRAIFEDHEFNLWVTTEGGGVTKLMRNRNDSTSFTPTHFFHQKNLVNSLLNNKVFSIAEDKYHTMWFGTNSGLSRYNQTSHSWMHFSMSNGLPDNTIMSVLFDGKEHLWVSHKKGISRIDIKNLQIRNFNTHDGIQGNEFTQNANYRIPKTDEIFFGGTNGLNSFFPDSIKDNKHKPKVVLTELSVMGQTLHPGTLVNNRVILEKSLLCTSQITLTWWDKTFSLQFAALHFENPRGNKYKYKLEGIDAQWIYTDASMRIASYSYLPSGVYVFKVYASNCDGVWGDIPATLQITVLPPLWFSWWAILIYFIIAGSLIVFVYKYVVGRMELHKNEEIHQAKLKFFTEVSHEFRTPLTLIIDPLEKIVNENLSKENIKQYGVLMYRNAQQLLLLVNQLLDFRKLETGHLTLNLQSSDIVSFIRTMASSFEPHATNRNIEFTIHATVKSLVIPFDGPKLNMVLNNLLSNAFKFVPDNGKIEVVIEPNSKNKNLIIRVKDNGEGIPKEEQSKIFDIFYQSKNAKSQHQGSGIGLALTKSLVQLHGGEITLESEVGNGSCFSVSLPISEELTDSVTDLAYPTSDILENDAAVKEASDVHTDKPLLLVVDDNADIRGYIEQNFSKTCRIELAPNGYKGFEIATNLIPDIIISDIMMPGMSGLELCRLIKSDERTSHIPVVLLTAKQSDEAKTEGYETGADAYITKPFNTSVLQAQVRNILMQRQRLRELFSNGSDIELKKIAINATDDAFLRKVVKLVEENMENEDFDIDLLADKLKMSRSQFYKKIKALTNKSLQDFVSALRMNKALEYLLSGEFSISEIAYKVGYSLPTNFTRSFVKHFGTTPRKYADMLKNSEK